MIKTSDLITVTSEKSENSTLRLQTTMMVTLALNLLIISSGWVLVAYAAVIAFLV